MRALSFVAGMALLFGPLFQVEGQTATRLGFINSQAIIEQAPGASEAEDQFERDMARYRAELQQMAEGIQNLITQFDQQQLTLSAEAKQNREEEIRQRQQAYQSRVEELDQQASQRRQELLEPIMNEINGVIEAIRAEGNYAMIFDVAAGAIIAADPAMDLTQQVIDRLRTSTGDGRQ
jgi:outer membrane protein